ncbi:MAG: 50S ribosomal protein L29 [Armatimonadia bacterium]|jgi:large subunit ribosomal protein L29|nr:50S ribosomal protein L29 [Armatimonadia bacterium]
MRKASDYRAMSDEDLQHEFLSAKEELFRLRYRMASHQLDDTKAVWRARKEIARLATVMRERQLETTSTESAGS